MVFSVDGKLLYVGWENTGIATYDLTHDTPPKGTKPDDEPFLVGGPMMPKDINPNADYGIGNLTVSDDGQWLAGTCNTVSVCVWNLKSKTVRQWRDWKEPVPQTESLAFRKGSVLIDIKGDDGTSYVFDAVKLALVK